MDRGYCSLRRTLERAIEFRGDSIAMNRESRDEAVKKYGAIEGGKQHLAKLETYIKENLS